MTRQTTTLTDRYVWTVTQHLPADTATDVARELRATILDTVDDLVAGGEDPVRAERKALTDLGDPAVLARRYGGRPGHLVGPGLYTDYVRLLRLLLAVVLPIVLVAHLVARVLATDDGWLAILGGTASLLFNVGVQLAFWVTVTFVVIERSRPEEDRGRSLTTWDPDQLPEETPARRVGLGETVWSVAFSLALAALVAWQFAGVDAPAIQVLNPQVDIVWQVTLVALLALDAVLALGVWRAGRWTPSAAAVNVASNVAAAALIVWLLTSEQLLADLPQVLSERFGATVDWGVSTAVTAAVVVLIAAWDAVDSVLKARRSRWAGPS